jgi:hypothetical protein
MKVTAHRAFAPPAGRPLPGRGVPSYGKRVYACHPLLEHEPGPFPPRTGCEPATPSSGAGAAASVHRIVMLGSFNDNESHVLHDLSAQPSGGIAKSQSVTSCAPMLPPRQRVGGSPSMCEIRRRVSTNEYSLQAIEHARSARLDIHVARVWSGHTWRSDHANTGFVSDARLR